ncbi:MAG: flavin reductase family protein [Candidatus Marinimicrobia bacterium]|nr:flavin reductase family protein [Candidatus Neomarinimicrobiota bacterium]
MANFKEYNPKELEIREQYRLLIGSVAPRPIGFATSKSKDGIINLAPFSFYNAFSANPPIVGISPAFSGRTGGAKNTLTNILDTKEFTLSVVSFDMVEQMNICAAEYSPDVDEFEKSGLTKLPPKMVSTPGVAESPLIMECQFTEHVQFSDKPAGGNLLLGEVVYFHANDEAFGEGGQIDPHKMDQVARMGMNWYSRANKGLFELAAPKHIPIGVDNLPKIVRNHPSFTGKLLARLASVEKIPEQDVIEDLSETYSRLSDEDMLKICAVLVEEGRILEAWQVLYLAEVI